MCLLYTRRKFRRIFHVAWTWRLVCCPNRFPMWEKMFSSIIEFNMRTRSHVILTKSWSTTSTLTAPWHRFLAVHKTQITLWHDHRETCIRLESMLRRLGTLEMVYNELERRCKERIRMNLILSSALIKNYLKNGPMVLNRIAVRNTLSFRRPSTVLSQTLV